MWAARKKSGFTIVELLIVIVVIAILAAITIVAYNGIRQRANNNAIIHSVSQTIKSIQSYYAATSEYPSTSGSSFCITNGSGCIFDTGAVITGNSTFDTTIAKVSLPPQNVPNVGTVANGIAYSYVSNRTFNGELRPVILVYYLNGISQQCGLGNVTSPASWTVMTSSTNGYTASNASSTGKTLCYVSIAI